jgi:hypothetical protein
MVAPSARAADLVALRSPPAADAPVAGPATHTRVPRNAVSGVAGFN